jgi:hypothetical protein
MNGRILGLAAVLFAAGCGTIDLGGDFMLARSGYSLDLAPYGDEFAIRVHANELRQLGGDVKSAQFHLYVAERLRRQGYCLGGWEEQLCADPDLCVHRTRNSVTVRGRCIPQFTSGFSPP